MFICQVTNAQTAPGEPMTRVVTERRVKVYYNEAGEEVGRGWEIVKEINASPVGLEIIRRAQAADGEVPNG